MRTRLTIMAIVLAAAAAAAGVVALLVVQLGWLGLAIAVVGTVAVLVGYWVLAQPWQHRWGATDEEVRRAMPGDKLLPTASGTTTRAIGIAAPPEQVWPWLVQLGADVGPQAARPPALDAVGVAGGGVQAVAQLVLAVVGAVGSIPG